MIERLQAIANLILTICSIIWMVLQIVEKIIKISKKKKPTNRPKRRKLKR